MVIYAGTKKYENMKRTISILTGLFLLLHLWSCNENPIDSEQYKKRIYIVKSIDKVYTSDLKYSDSIQETFVSVAISGSQPQDQNVKIELELVPEAVGIYNEKYIGRWSSKPYYTVMPDRFYSIPSMETEMYAGGETFARLPILMNTADIHCDSTYTIPIAIKSVSAYEVNTEISSLLMAFNMVNDYSGIYQMIGKKTETANGNSSNIGKSKTLKAISEKAVRMFIEASKDDDKTLIPSTNVVITVASDNSVAVTPWDAANANFTITGSGGTYNPANKSFNIWYSYTDTSGKEFKITENLENR